MFGSTWGQNNQQQQQQQQQQQAGGLFGGGSTSTGFGGSGFGQQQNTGGFGAQPAQQNTGGGIFGSNTATNTGFGGGGFGQQATQSTNAFGARPSFGAAGSTPFGQQASTNTGGGLFGSSNSTTSTFGQPANTSGGMFGAKPATTGFGAPAATNSLFGKPATTGFGAQPSTGFGASTGGFGTQSTMNANQVHQYTTNPPPPIPETGTAAPPYHPTWWRDPPVQGKEQPPHLFNVIDAMEPYRGASLEELRMLDYQQGRKQPTAQPAATGGFGQPAAGGFGQPAATTSTFGQPAGQSTGFGAAKPTGMFGSSTPNTGFGASSTGAGGFGQTQSTGTSLFGQPANTSTGGFGQSTGTTSNLFGQPQQPQQQQNNATGGIFGNSNPFGQNNQQQQAAPTTFGSFGAAAKPATTGFGQTSTGSTGFGGFGQQQQQQQPAQTGGGMFGGGGFGQNNTTQTNTTGGLFGQNNNQPQQPAAGGLFGSQNKPAGGLFGSTTTPATTTPATTGFGGFGQNTATAAQPATGGGLFGGGAATTQPAASGSLFGAPQQTTQPASTSLFGGNTGGTGLFGAKPAAPAATGGGLFGSTATTTQPSTGLFGQSTSTPAAGGGLFGNTNQAQNNAAKPAGGLFGGSTSIFGQQNQAAPAQPAAATGGLFGGLGQSQPASTGGLFGNAQPNQSTLGQSTSMFGGLGQSTAQPQTASLTASVDSNPYGKNDLFAYQGQKLDLGSSGPKKPALPPLTSSTFRVTPTKNRLTKLRGFGSSSVGASQGPGSPNFGSPSRSSVQFERYKGLADTALSPNAFLPRSSVKKLNISSTNNVSNGDDPLDSVLGKSTLRASVNGSAPPTPDVPTPSRNSALQLPSAAAETPTRAAQSTPLEASSMRVVASDRPLKRGDYWCRPRLDTLRAMPKDELKRIEHFTAGRKGYGEVTFLEPVDLDSIPSLHDLLGGVIIIDELELVVYPDDKNKPARGKGLNVPAEISLENCYARDKATRQPIKDPKDPRYQRQIKRVKAVADTEFVDFTPDGVWIFKVEHFSRYGLDDSDEESNEGAGSPTPPAKALLKEQSYSSSEEDEDDFLPPTKSMHDADMTEYDSEDREEDDDESSFDEGSSMEEDYGVNDLAEWDRPLQSKVGDEGMRKVREMQSSFFGNTQTKAPHQTAAQIKRTQAMEAARAIERKRAEAGFGEAEEGDTGLDNRAAVNRASFGDLAPRPAVPEQQRHPRKYAKVSLADSLVAGNDSVQVDAGLSLGRSFRCTWGPNGELVHFGKICAPDTKFASSPDPVVYIQKVDLLADTKEAEESQAKRLLDLVLKNSAIQSVDGVPAAHLDEGIRFHQFTAMFEDADRSHEASIWRLGHALFDEIDLGLPDSTPDDVRTRVAEVRRKLALSKWLEDAVAPDVDSDLVKAGDNRAAKLFSLLTGNQLDRAVQSALDGKDMRLATLIAQAGGPETFRAEVGRQLEDWAKYEANGHIGYDYRKLYALLAGVTDMSPGDGKKVKDVVIAEGLDWKRAFGIRMWYGSYLEDGIADVLENYTSALEKANAPAEPLPPYVEKPDGRRQWNTPAQSTDILFDMIRMYADLAVPLDKVLGARGSSSSPTDLRLPWHLYLVLAQALKKRDFEDREEPNEDGQCFSATADQMTSAYAAQLESEGLWTWAAYVLLYLERAESRRAAIRALLFRHPEPAPSEREFLVDVLQVPKAWLEESLAAKYASEGDAYQEYLALIRASLPERAQYVLVSKLAPEAILRQDYNLLGRLCELLKPLQPNDWEYNGKLLMDYVELSTKLRPLLHSVLKAGAHPDATEAADLSRLASWLPKTIDLLPRLYAGQKDVQKVACLSGMLSDLQSLGSVLHAAGYIPRPPVSNLLVDKDRLHLLQSAATESFERSLGALTASA